MELLKELIGLNFRIADFLSSEFIEFLRFHTLTGHVLRHQQPEASMYGD